MTLAYGWILLSCPSYFLIEYPGFSDRNLKTHSLRFLKHSFQKSSIPGIKQLNLLLRKIPCFLQLFLLLLHLLIFLQLPALSFRRQVPLLRTTADYISEVNLFPPYKSPIHVPAYPCIPDAIPVTIRFISVSTKSDTYGSSCIVKNKTRNPSNILSWIPTENIFICGAIFAMIPRIQFNIINTAKTGSATRKPSTIESVI